MGKRTHSAATYDEHIQQIMMKNRRIAPVHPITFNRSEYSS